MANEKRRLILALDFEVVEDPWDKGEFSDELIGIEVLDDGGVDTDAITDYWGQSDFGQVTVHNGFFEALYTGLWKVPDGR